jgi:release factor glutamine methyltransferase
VGEVAYSPSPMPSTSTPNSGSETVSVRDLLRRASAALGAGPEAVLDSELLVAEATEMDRTALITHPETTANADQIADLESLLARRMSGEPMAYVLGYWGFWTLEFMTRPGTLVPRPETELLVERALVLSTDPVARILDLGTGSGAIALALASERPRAEITATEASDPAFALARDNAAANELELELLLGDPEDWFLPVTARQFDLIVSNPPYVAIDDPALEPEVARFEPTEALLAGADGLDDLRSIIAGASGHLLAGGWLVVEHGYQQGPAVRALFAGAGFEQIDTHRDLAGHERVTEGRRL